MGHPLKVPDAVVGLVAVAVIRLATIRRLAQKRTRD